MLFFKHFDNFNHYINTAISSIRCSIPLGTINHTGKSDVFPTMFSPIFLLALLAASSLANEIYCPSEGTTYLQHPTIEGKLIGCINGVPTGTLDCPDNLLFDPVGNFCYNRTEVLRDNRPRPRTEFSRHWTCPGNPWCPTQPDPCPNYPNCPPSVQPPPCHTHPCPPTPPIAPLPCPTFPHCPPPCPTHPNCPPLIAPPICPGHPNCPPVIAPPICPGHPSCLPVIPPPPCPGHPNCLPAIPPPPCPGHPNCLPEIPPPSCHPHCPPAIRPPVFPDFSVCPGYPGYPGYGHPVGQCPFCNDVCKVHFLTDARDCTVFYMCNWGIPIWQRCPAGLHFNRQTETCDFVWRAGCAHHAVPCQ